MASLVPSSWPGRVIAGLLIWYAATVLGWGARPMTDHVPVALAPDAPEGAEVDERQTAEAVRCHSPLSGDGSVRGPLPVLEAHQVYARTPCATPVREARQLLVLDTVVVLGALTGAVAYGARRRDEPGDGNEPESVAVS